MEVYAGIVQAAPLTIYVRQRLCRNGFGKEEWLDYERIMVIPLLVDYDGPLSVEYDVRAQGGRQVDAVRRAAAELRGLR